MKTIKEYLGDSVYAEWNGWQITLTTENGMGPSNTIIIEEDQIGRLAYFVEQAKERLKEENEQGKENDSKNF